jgi:acyl carrier protein
MTQEDITKKIILSINKNFGVPKAKVFFDSTFESVGIDSLDRVEIITDMENEFKIEIPDNKLLVLRTVGLLVEYVDDSLHNKLG